MAEMRAAGLDEIHPVVPANLIGDADPFVKLDQVRAQPEQHVLAVVHHFAGAGMLLGRSAAPRNGRFSKSVT